jgi:hypothetical protein
MTSEGGREAALAGSECRRDPRAAPTGKPRETCRLTRLPALVRTPSELTAAAARLSNVKGAARVDGALAGGVVIAALGAAATLLSAAVAVAVAGGVLVPVARRLRGLRAEPGANAAGPPGLRRLGMDSRVARVMAVWGVRSFVRGLWLTLTTVVALELMGLDESGVGVLMAAAGVGVFMAFPASALLGGPQLAAGAPRGRAYALWGPSAPDRGRA